MIAFTLCSNNYWPYAKSLAESWCRHHPGEIFVIGLVDSKLATLNYATQNGIEVLEAAEVGIPNLSELASKYTICELNVAVKPFYFKHLLFDKNHEKVVYLDPDILIFSPLSEIDAWLSDNDFVLTPHICSPIREISVGPNEYHLLRGGVFNLGFLGIARTKSAEALVIWWMARMSVYCYCHEEMGLFYDQIWFNYVVIFSDRYKIVSHRGYNVSNWNLHEREITSDGHRFLVNGQWNLKFFHFSHYQVGHSKKLCSYNDRYTFENRPDVLPLFQLFSERVIAAGYHQYRNLKCSYFALYEQRNRTWIHGIKKYLGLRDKLHAEYYGGKRPRLYIREGSAENQFWGDMHNVAAYTRKCGKP